MENREVTISTHNGSQYRREHNRRNPRVILKEDHIDPNGHFEVWLDEDPKAAYERIFGQAVQEYNSKQTREDRKIADYYANICQDEKKHAVYEMIIGIYGRNPDGTPVCSKAEGRNILRAFVDDWQRRNPTLELIGAYYHADEEGQNHVHLDYICVGSGYAKGLQKRSSCSKALQEMGFKAQGQQTEQMQWQARENQHLGNLCSLRGLTVLHPGSKRHLETEVFKAERQLHEKQQAVAAAEKELALKQEELQTIQDGIDTLRDRKSLSQTVLEVAELPDRPIEVEIVPAKKKTLTRPAEPAKAVMLEDDYIELRRRAYASTMLQRAHDELKALGNRLLKELDRNRLIAELRSKLAAAEMEANQTRMELDLTRAEMSQTRDEMSQQQDFMARTTDRSGRTIWELFVQFLQKDRERELQEEHIHGIGE